MSKRTINLDTCGRLFMVFTPSRTPIYWTANRRAKDAVSAFVARQGKSWGELVGAGYELRKLFYTHTQATHRTLNTFGPLTRDHLLETA